MIDPSARGAWRALESKLRPFVARRVPTSADAEDVLQDIFVRMQRGLPSLREDQRFGPWVYQVARSVVADHWRSSTRRTNLTADAPDEALDAAAPVAWIDEEGDVEREVAGYLALFVSMLPSPYREALTLTELEGLTQKDAAAMLGISVSGMKSRVQRGRQRLRAALEACCNIALDARGRVMSCEPRPEGPMPDGCCCDGRSKDPS